MNVFAPFVSFYESWLNTVKGLLLLLQQWYYLADRAEILPGPIALIAIPLLLALYLSNGFIAATYTEVQGRSRLGHFLGGLFFPALYPFITSRLKNMRVDEIKVKKDKERHQRQGLIQEVTAKLYENTGKEYIPTPDIDPQIPLPEETIEVLQDGEVKMCQMYFASIATRADGTPAGPFLVKMMDGREMEASHIVEVMENVVVFELIGPDEKTRTIRAMYDKIAECKLME